MKITELRNVKVGVDPIAPVNGITAYRLTIQDTDAGEVTWLSFGQETADSIIAAITGIQVVQRLPEH